MARMIEKIPAGPVQANCYIVSLPGRDDCLMIDPGGEGKRLKAALKERKLAAVLLTHGHFDHIGAVDQVATPDTKVYIHTLDQPMLLNAKLNASPMIRKEIVIAHPSTRVEDGTCIQAAGIEIVVRHTPGHTQGGVCYQIGDCLFTGDTLFLHSYGRTDLPGGDEKALQQSLIALLSIKEDLMVYPGHDAATTLKAEREFFT